MVFNNDDPTKKTNSFARMRLFQTAALFFVSSHKYNISSEWWICAFQANFNLRTLPQFWIVHFSMIEIYPIDSFEKILAPKTTYSSNDIIYVVLNIWYIRYVNTTKRWYWLIKKIVLRTNIKSQTQAQMLVNHSRDIYRLRFFPLYYHWLWHISK